MKLLLVEDEKKTAQSLQKGLEENQFFVDVAYDGDEGWQKFNAARYDLVISDVIMPGVGGIDLCRRIRSQKPDVPLILLTALGTVSDKVAGFDAGTDDYLVKPFEFQELLARVRALLKRTGKKSPAGSLLTIADLTLNLDTKEVHRSGKLISLTAREFALLEYFIRNEGRVLSRHEINEKVWDIHFDTGTNVIEVYVNYLRNKIDKDFEDKLIHTRVGMGYVMKSPA